MGKWVTGLIYMFTGGLAFIGGLYDYCTLNGQISEINAEKRSKSGGQPRPERLIEGCSLDSAKSERNFPFRIGPIGSNDPCTH